MERIIITGANRGLGLEMVRQFLQKSGTFIWATARRTDGASELQRLAASHAERLRLVALDVTSADSISSAAERIADEADGIDLLINNAGVKPSSESLEAITAPILRQTFEVNAVAPLMITKALLPLLTRGTNPRLVNISSQLGSITEPHGEYYAYNPSKAALNLITRMLAQELLPHGITSVVLHPGWVRTDMGGPDGELSKEDSVRGLLNVISKLNSSQNGRFLQWDGRPHAW